MDEHAASARRPTGRCPRAEHGEHRCDRVEDTPGEIRGEDLPRCNPKSHSSDCAGK